MNIDKLKNIIIIVIGGFAIYWIYKVFAGPESLEYIIKHKDKFFILIIAHIPTIYFDALSWQLLMKKNYLGIFWCFIISWISQTAGKVMPTGNITGEFVRIYLSVKKGMKLSEASSTVIGDLALAAFSLLLITIFSLSFILFSYKDFLLLDEDNIYLLLSIFVLILFSILFCLMIRKRFIRFLLRNSHKYTSFKLSKKLINSLIRFDYELNLLSYRLRIVFFALFIRMLGWIGGAFEIYVFFLIIGIDVSIMDVLIIESFTAILRAIVFFVPAGLGIQEFAFVIAGSFVGLSSEAAFSAAIGRRLREVLVGIPALISWYILFNKKKSNFN